MEGSFTTVSIVAAADEKVQCAAPKHLQAVLSDVVREPTRSRRPTCPPHGPTEFLYWLVETVRAKWRKRELLLRERGRAEEQRDER
jgi:hypothetical protein